MVNSSEKTLQTPLYQRHVDADARMVSFAGWDMPVQYKTGIIAEHNHTRTQAGLFDICHMGEFYVRGKDAMATVENLLTCNVRDLALGQCRYGMMLNENGGVIDDLIVFHTSQDEYLLVVNAGTRPKDFAWIENNLKGDATASDESDDIGKLDLQGPKAHLVLTDIFDESIRKIKRFTFADYAYQGITITVSRTGYTGERGYELFFPAEHSEKIWDLLNGYDEVMPIGLGARDTLRMEKGFALYGNDISEKTTPIDAGLNRFIDFDKDFIGKNILEKQVTDGVAQTLVGFKCEGRRAGRAHYQIVVDEQVVGEVTSGAFSPSLNHSIGYGYINKEFSNDGQEIILTDGKRAKINGVVSAFPLYRKPKKKM